MEYTACDKNMHTRMYKTVMRADILPCAAFVFLSSSPMLRLMREEITVPYLWGCMHSHIEAETK